MLEIRDCLQKKIGELNEATLEFHSRFGKDGFDGKLPDGKGITIRHGKTATTIRRDNDLRYVVESHLYR